MVVVYIVVSLKVDNDLSFYDEALCGLNDIIIAF